MNSKGANEKHPTCDMFKGKGKGGDGSWVLDPAEEGIIDIPTIRENPVDSML